MEGRISQIETFGSVDGPGIRFVIFTQGCKFRCKYCHNPETWNLNGGELVSSDELLNKALRYKAYWGKEGGITVSGGEPLLQIDFLIDLFQKAKALGINTCLDTSGGPFSLDKNYLVKFDELLKYTDLILLDIKHINDQKHIDLTGKTNKNILELAKYLDNKNIPVWIRHVLVPTITDYDEYLIELRKFIDTLSNVKKVEVLPYHNLQIIKYNDLKIKYPLEDVDIPTEERIENAKKILGAN